MRGRQCSLWYPRSFVRHGPYAFILLGMLYSLLGNAYAAGIAASKHNLSISGPGAVKSTSEARVCVFCHVPHSKMAGVAGTNLPLWNHTLSKASYQLYESASMLNRTIQPDGSSRACLGCHDGTVAIGALVNTGGSQASLAIVGTGSGGVMPPGSSSLGTNLSGHHPVSIEMNNTLVHDKERQFNDNIVSYKICIPTSASLVKLEKTSNTYGGASTGLGVQCSSCHDPHNDPDPGNTVFLRVGNRNDFDPLCTACHRGGSEACP